MIFEPTAIPGAFLLRLERNEDERGFFARTWSAKELEARGLDARLVESSLSWNARTGTLRGMHFQVAPFEEAKLVSCVRGAIYDVVVDLRPDSATRHRWYGVRLDGRNLDLLYVPPGCAHGFLTLEDDALVHYQISERHSPEHARGIRWDDPTIGIRWPVAPAVISERDRSFPLIEG